MMRSSCQTGTQAHASGHQGRREGRSGSTRLAPAVFSLILIGKDLLVNNLPKSYHFPILLAGEGPVEEKWTLRGIHWHKRAVLHHSASQSFKLGKAAISSLPIPIFFALNMRDYCGALTCWQGSALMSLFTAIILLLSFPFLNHNSGPPDNMDYSTLVARCSGLRLGRGLSMQRSSMLEEDWDLNKGRTNCKTQTMESVLLKETSRMWDRRRYIEGRFLLS